MQGSNRNNRIEYVEFPAPDAVALAKAKEFYGRVFGWQYKDWGADYVDTQSSGVASGINSDSSHRPRQPLAVIFADNLETARTNAVAAGAKLSRDIFSFPGGRRFHFVDPAGVELAVWSDK